jgi:deazaflavin-dependent oxidoreductase (nitroreductase family)
MSQESLPTGPDREALIRLIREAYPDADFVTMEGAAFFSLDDQHWPNFATVVWTDDFDEGSPSNLSRPGVYRLNIGLDKETFRRLVGNLRDPDYAAFDRVLPHPVYAKQRWIGILNPSHATVQDTLLQLVADAHDRLIAVRDRKRAARSSRDGRNVAAPPPPPHTRMRFLRPFTTHIVNPVMRLFIKWLPHFAIIRYRGRRSGKRYRTPMNVFRDGDAYVFALTYGSDVQWVKNVLAAGKADLEIRNRVIHLTDPEMFVDPTRRLMPQPVRLVLGLMRVSEFLRMRKVGTE